MMIPMCKYSLIYIEKLLGHKVPKKYILLQDCIKEPAEERKKENKEPVVDDDTYV